MIYGAKWDVLMNIFINIDEINYCVWEIQKLDGY